MLHSILFYRPKNILFKIRAYTALDKFSETSWSQPISTDPDNTAILVGITVPVILIIIILLAFVLIRKLHCNNCTKTFSHYTDRQADLVSVSQDNCIWLPVARLSAYKYPLVRLVRAVSVQSDYFISGEPSGFCD